MNTFKIDDPYSPVPKYLLFTVCKLSFFCGFFISCTINLTKIALKFQTKKNGEFEFHFSTNFIIRIVCKLQKPCQLLTNVKTFIEKKRHRRFIKVLIEFYLSANVSVLNKRTLQILLVRRRNFFCSSQYVRTRYDPSFLPRNF